MTKEVDVREIAQCSCLRLRRISRRMTQIYDRALEPGGLTINQFGMLGRLYGARLRNEILSISALADRLGMDPTTLNRSLRPLEKAGFIADRVNKMPLVVAFMGTYYLLFTATAFIGDAAWVSEIFRTPDVQAVLYFALFILTDPPTSPVKYRDQITFAIIVAVSSYAIFEWTGAVYYLLAGVLVGNVWEAWRRVHRRTGLRFPRGLPHFVREVSGVRSLFSHPGPNELQICARTKLSSVRPRMGK